MSAVPAHAPRPPRPAVPRPGGTAPQRATGSAQRAPAPGQRGGNRASEVKPRLEVVRAPVHTRTRVPFVSLCMSILGLALLASLLLNTTMAQSSYHQHALMIEMSSLNRSIQESQAALDTAASPRQLAKSATRLGMVQAPDIAFLSIEKAKVLGNPKPAEPPLTPNEAEGGQ